MRIIKLLLAGLILSLFFSAGDIKADYIYMKDGSVISGVLVETKGNLLVYRTAHGEMFINRENITEIIYESKDKPLLREAEKHLEDKKFKRAIKTCGEVLEISPDSPKALELKQKAISAWHRYADREKEGAKALKAKLGISIKKEKTNYIIADVYYNCPLTNGEIKPGDILIAVQNTDVKTSSIEKAYDLLLKSQKINLTIHRPIVLTIEEISWRGTKRYPGLGISIEKVDRGIRITDLMPNGPAVKAGVLKNDIITRLKGQTISSSSMDSIIKMLKGNAGTKLQAAVEREVIIEVPMEVWRKHEAEREGKIRQEEESEPKAKEEKDIQTALKTKLGISIKKEKTNYIIADVYYNCPLTNGEIKPGDILIAVQNTDVKTSSIEKVYDLLLKSQKINLTIHRPIVLTIEEISWRGTKRYPGLGISIEKVDRGIRITDLMPNGPAAKAGVLKNDIIISLKGETISSSSMDETIKMLKGNAGTKLQAAILREVSLD